MTVDDIREDGRVVQDSSSGMADELHETVHEDLRIQDLARVNGVDHLRVTEICPDVQDDFCTSTDPWTVENHPEIPRKTNHYSDPDTGEEWTEVTPKPNGKRVTLTDPDGREYAAVDWVKSEDPPQFYQKVIDDPDPANVRWNLRGPVTEVQRYGPEPVYVQNLREGPEDRLSTSEKRVEVLTLAADGDLESDADLADPADLRDLADRHRDADKLVLTASEVQDLRAAYTAALDHVKRTEDPLFHHPEPPNPQRTPVERAIRNRRRSRNAKRRARMVACFPDGEGGHVLKSRSYKNRIRLVERYPDGFEVVE